MKHCLLLTFLTLVVAYNSFAGDYIKTADGIIVHPDRPYSGNVKEVQLKVISPNIIRVVVSAETIKSFFPSFMITEVSRPVEKWDIIASGLIVSIRTKHIRAAVNLQTGSVSFFDLNGKKIIAEKELGRSFNKTVFEGEQLYGIRQDFVTSPDDAWYGLGQHQDAIMNYKGYQVQLYQNNTEVAVPFLISKKNYGILWDNYSLTQFGDVRPYLPINALKIFSKNGEEGWFTVKYSNDKNDPSKVAVGRAESVINYEFLNDSKLFLPKEFKPENGVAIWEGSIASLQTGIHKLRFTYGGYAKVWIDNVLVLDRWRQAWNPGSAILDVRFQAGIKKTIKVEWIPNGGESYLSLKCLPPLSNEELNSYSFSSEAGKALDYYFIYGNSMDDVIVGYRELTGKAVILPKWAYGKWQSRERYKTQQELLDVVEQFRKRKIPLDNIVLDWNYWKEPEWGSQDFDASRFSNPDSAIKELHNKYNTHFMISVWPKFYEGIPAYNEFNSKGWLYKRNVADRQRDWIAQGYISTFYDVFNKDAQKGFWNLINKKLYTRGVDAWWMDASEPDILSNVSPARRKEQMTPTASGPAALNLNAYPLLNAKGIYEGQRATNANSRVFILTRSAYAGLQRYASATWSGDIASRWEDMKAQISAGTNFSMSGIPSWTMDIGGFAVEQRYERPNEKDLSEWRELMTRWYQFGAFVPIFRVHGQFPFREIFNIAPEEHPAYKSMLYYDKLRYKLLPYIYSLAGDTYHNDGTIMRGLVMDFSYDDKVLSINDQYLFGKSLLINPVYNYGAKSREVYLPKGTGWFDLYNGKYYDGGKTINADAAYEKMPVFVKSGSILPLGPDLQYTSEKPADEITLLVYAGGSGSFNLYEDEGINYNYEKDRYAIIPFKYDDKTKTLIIDDIKGSFNGMLRERKFNIKWISKNAEKGIDNMGKPEETILYNGKKVEVKRK